MIFTFGVTDLQFSKKNSTMMPNLKNAKLWTLDAVHANIKTNKQNRLHTRFTA